MACDRAAEANDREALDAVAEGAWLEADAIAEACESVGNIAETG